MSATWQGPANTGRGQTLSFAQSLGDIPWFDVRGDIQRCDWSEHSSFSYVPNMNYQAMDCKPITALCFNPNTKPQNFAERRVEW